MATRQFTVSSELQQFLQGIGSKALTNVVWNTSFTDPPVLPISSVSVRRSIIFDKVMTTDFATPVDEYNCFIENLNGSDEMPVTSPRTL
jgi:hypothetical protein